METTEDNLYDHPQYYDLVFGSDWKAEYDFLLACFERHLSRPAERLFEPACGTGRLLYRLAQAGFEVSGLDLNEKAVEYCNKRLERHGFDPTAIVGDMTDFKLPKRADAAFNTINSFRHLTSAQQAEDHLRCMAAALRKGGIYILGLHLTPAEGSPMEEESWSAQRGHLCVNTHMWAIGFDPKRRTETFGMRYDVYTPTKQFRIANEIVFRTYTRVQFHALIESTGVFDIEETYDFGYEIDEPIDVDDATEDVVFILKKR